MIFHLASILDHPACVIIDIFTLWAQHHLTGSLLNGFSFRAGLFSETLKQKLFIPICDCGHWVLIKYNKYADHLVVFNSLMRVPLTTAVRTIRDCLIRDFERDTIEIRPYLNCPQQINNVDCGYFVITFLLMDMYEFDVSRLNVTSSALRAFVRTCLATKNCSRSAVSDFLEQVQDLPTVVRLQDCNKESFKKRSAHKRCDEFEPHKSGRKEKTMVAQNLKRKTNRLNRSTLMKARQNDPELINSIIPHYIGQMNIVCPHCRAQFFPGENMNDCCKGGWLCPLLCTRFYKLENIPKLIKELFDNYHPLSKPFFEHIRSLNSAFSFTSIGISKRLKRNEAIRVDASLGGFTIVFHGSIFHQIGGLTPKIGDERKFSQILFYDTDHEEAQRRKQLVNQYGGQVPEELVNLIQNELHKSNELYQHFKPIGHQVINEPGHHMVIEDDFRRLKIKKSKTESKQYEKPAGRELGVIIPTKNNDLKYSRDIVIQRVDSSLKRITELHPAVDALGYVLLNPTGVLGWSPEMTFECPESRNCKAERTVQIGNSERELISEPERDAPIETSPGRKATKEKWVTRNLTLLMFLHFFIYTRKECFNLLHKG